MPQTDMKAFFSQHRLILAPMAGVSDKAFRTLCVEQGAKLTYTEMVSAKGLSYGNEKTRALLDLAVGEHQVAVQIFGHEAAVMAAQAASISEQMGDRLAYIDINMGCPAKKIVKKGDGCALMKTPDLSVDIVRQVSSATTIPVSVKFRRGFELGVDTSVEFAKRMEEAGAQALAVHGRYAEQYYRGDADWSVIANVKQAVSIPVIGNGDITRGRDVTDMLEHTACDAYMIGRAARGNPWIFASAQAALDGKDEPLAPTAEQRIAYARYHATLLAQEAEHNIVRMRKHAMWYFSGLPGASAARAKINHCSSIDEFNEVFDELLLAVKG